MAYNNDVTNHKHPYTPHIHGKQDLHKAGALENLHSRLAVLEERLFQKASPPPPCHHCAEHQLCGSRDSAGARDAFVTYSETSTCHGVSYVLGRGRAAVQRAVWAACLAACVAAWLYLASSAVARYISHPTSTSSETVYLEALSFPQLTLCTYPRYRADYLRRQHLAGVYIPFEDGAAPQAYIESVHLSTLKQLLRSGQLNTHLNHTDVSADILDNLDDLDYASLCLRLMASGHRSCDQLWAELYNGSVYDEERALLAGGVSIQDILPNATYQCGRMFHTAASWSWVGCDVTTHVLSGLDHGLCHTLTFLGHDGRPLRAYRKEPLNMLILSLLSDSTDVHVTYKATFHAINRTVDMTIPQLYIQAGHSNHIKLERLVSVRLASHSDCVDSLASTSLLRHHDTYSYEACLHECRNDEMVRRCGCRDYGIAMDTGVRACNSREIRVCDPSAYLSCPQCRRPCHDDRYKPTLTDLGAVHSNNFTGINIWYPELAFTRNTQVLSYPAVSLFGDVGGQLGLFVGASLLTVVEFLDLVAVIVARASARLVSDRRSAHTAADTRDVEAGEDGHLTMA